MSAFLTKLENAIMTDIFKNNAGLVFELVLIQSISQNVMIFTYQTEMNFCETLKIAEVFVHYKQIYSCEPYEYGERARKGVVCR